MLLHPLQTAWDADLRGGDPIGFPGYTPPEEESVLTGVTEAGCALIQGRFDVVGDRLRRLDAATFRSLGSTPS